MQSVEEIKGNDKLILVYPINVVKRGVVVGIKIEADNSISYTISPRGINFNTLANKPTAYRVNSKDINKGEIQIIKHVL